MKRIEFKDHDHRQLVSDLCAIAEKFHAHGSLRNRLAGAVGQFFDASEIKSGASSSAAVPVDALPPLPKEMAWYDDNRMFYQFGEPEFTANYYTAEQMQAYARAAVEADRAQQGEPVDVCAQMRALCSACGGTGDVVSLDGEWRGKCDCAATKAAAPADAPRLSQYGYVNFETLDYVVGFGGDRIPEGYYPITIAAPVPDTGIPAAAKTDEPHPIASDSIPLEAKAGEGA